MMASAISIKGRLSIWPGLPIFFSSEACFCIPLGSWEHAISVLIIATVMTQNAQPPTHTVTQACSRAPQSPCAWAACGKARHVESKRNSSWRRNLRIEFLEGQILCRKLYCMESRRSSRGPAPRGMLPSAMLRGCPCATRVPFDITHQSHRFIDE